MPFGTKLVIKQNHQVKSISMKKLFLITITLLTTLTINAQKVYSTDQSYKADVKVYVVDQEYQADLLVFKVNADYKAKGNEGKWFFTDAEYKAVKKIYFTDAAYKADLKVFFVDSEYKSGWKDKSKQHFMY